MITYSIASSDYTFNVSVSTTTYESKEAFVAASKKLVYRKQPVNIGTMCQLIKEGHSFCHCYDDNDEPFTNSTKTQANFRYTSCIAYDIDDNTLPMEEYLTTLNYQPTIAYTTTSDGIKGNRYRFVYCFDGKITGKAQYEATFETVQVESGIGELKDNCTHSPAQAFFGNALPTCRMVCTNYVYNIPTAASTTTEKREKVSKQIKNKRRESDIICNDTFRNDFEGMSLRKFVSTYSSKYQPIEESELTYNNGYALIDENYLRIYRRWNADTRHIHRWQDGEGRRKKLATAALIIRKIKPDITAEHLIYCLAYEVVHYYSNIDGVLNKSLILRVATAALEKPIDEITIKGHDKRNYKVDMDYWKNLGVSPKAAVAKARAVWNDERIGELYDCQLTDKENAEVLAKFGQKVSVSTIKRWRKKHGITKYNKKT
ncbi:MAG: hypothetical protein J6I41_03495 [Bacteroidales bacterium]|nr:hypothetical protein [Bacteroidales bacterium]